MSFKVAVAYWASASAAMINDRSDDFPSKTHFFFEIAGFVLERGDVQRGT